MIEFIEKDPYMDNSPFTGKCMMHPTYMVKDGKEHFMFNRREPDDKWKRAEQDGMKQQLIDNGGMFMTFHGIYPHPKELIDYISKKHYHFTHPDRIFYVQEEENYIDFHGNLKEVSAAFHYRIYDAKLAEQVREATMHLNTGRWGNARKVFKEETKNA